MRRIHPVIASAWNCSLAALRNGRARWASPADEHRTYINPSSWSVIARNGRAHGVRRWSKYAQHAVAQPLQFLPAVGGEGLGHQLVMSAEYALSGLIANDLKVPDRVNEVGEKKSYGPWLRHHRAPQRDHKGED
jgi:hypothetical protein